MDTPQCNRVYENHHLASPRWREYQTRPGDILVATAYKSGTTWMQTIVANLIFQDGQLPAPVMDFSPWVDMRMIPFDHIKDITGAQTHRRVLKTHLALDGLPYKRDMRYIYVGRDLRDVFMSLWNHYSGHTEDAYLAINNPEGLVGPPLPRCTGDLLATWREWTRRSSFPWEKDGFPYWSSTHHAQSWWDYRHLDNMLFVHYNDLLAQPAVEIQRVADFLGIDVAADTLARIVERVSFRSMRANADNIVGHAAMFWEGGGKRFLNKGTNGRWRDVLGEEELAAYRAMCERTLSPDCDAWLERGRSALDGAAHA